MPALLCALPLLAACNVLAGLGDYGGPSTTTAAPTGGGGAGAAGGGTSDGGTSSSGGGPVGGSGPGGLGGMGGSTSCDPPAMPTPVSTAVLADAPLTYHRFELRDEPGIMFDWSGNCHHGFFGGGASYTSGLETGTQAFNVPLNSGHFGESSFALPGPDHAIEAWINPEGSSLVLTIADLVGTDAYAHFFVLGTTAELIYAPADEVSTWVRTGFIYQPGEWRHVAVSRAGNDVTLYVDGSAAEIDTVAVPPPTGDVTLTVGLRAADPMMAFIGLIDELAIYGTPLSDGAVTAHNVAAPL